MEEMQAIMTEAVLPIGLFLMNLGMGLSLRWHDFARVVQARKPALVGLGSLLVLLPGLGFLLARAFDLPPELAVGLVLVATCPGGMFSNLMTDYAKGNLALSVTLTAASSAIYIFTVPLWANLALSRFLGAAPDIALPFAETLIPLTLFVLLPVGLGMVARARAPRFADRNMGRVKNAAALIVLVIMIYIAATQRSDTVADLPRILGAVVALNLVSVLIAILLSLLTRLGRRDGVAVVMEHAVRQEGTGIFIAATLLGNATMALPLLLNSGVGMTIAVLVILFFRWKGRREAAASA